MTRTPDPYTPDEIDSLDCEDQRPDTGDGLDDPEACAFVEGTAYYGAPCPYPATTYRTMNDIDFACCPTHHETGGFLTQPGRQRLIAELVARQHLEAVRRVDIDGEVVQFARFCSGCGARLFTGNQWGKCFDCAAADAFAADNEVALVDEADVILDGADGLRQYFDCVWPPEATASPPRFPFLMDRREIESPLMPAWRAEHGLAR